VQRGSFGEIIVRLERKGFTLKGLGGVCGFSQTTRGPLQSPHPQKRLIMSEKGHSCTMWTSMIHQKDIRTNCPSCCHIPKGCIFRCWQVKPDGVQRGLVGEIIGRLERKGFTLKGLKMFVPPRELAEEHYKDLSSKPFFKDLVDYIISGPVVAMVRYDLPVLNHVSLTNTIHAQIYLTSKPFFKGLVEYINTRTYGRHVEMQAVGGSTLFFPPVP
jgi:nucleoside diphosphate kinase